MHVGSVIMLKSITRISLRFCSLSSPVKRTVIKMVRVTIQTPPMCVLNFLPPVQPHADASRFSDDVTKAAAYKQVIDETKALCEGQTNWVDAP